MGKAIEYPFQETGTGLVVSVTNVVTTQVLIGTSKSDNPVTAWDTEIKDLNSEFNLVNGMFTVGASGAGSYLFNVSLTMGLVEESQFFGCCFYVNGSRYFGQAPNQDNGWFIGSDGTIIGGQRAWASGSMTLDLEIGDTVVLNFAGVAGDRLQLSSFMQISKI